MKEKDYFKLDERASLFDKLKKLANCPTQTWWQQVLNDKDLYVNVRKDNRVCVYYMGAAVMKELHCGRAECCVCRIDKEYQKGWDRSNDSNKLFPAEEIVKNLPQIKKNIEEYYNKRKASTPEGGCEKQIQWGFYLKGEYIDTEFEYVDKNIGIIRIDLITISNDGRIEFVELKRISDSRLLKEEGSEETPEIIRQMDKYDRFIKENKDKIKEYYEKVQRIMVKIRVNNPLTDREIKGVARPARLLFAPYNDGKENNSRRIKRVTRIADLLEDKKITSNIDELLSMINE